MPRIKELSPVRASIEFRIATPIRQQLIAAARRRGITMSDLAREAVIAHLRAIESEKEA